MDPEVQATTIEDMLSEPALTGADLFMSKFQEFMQIGGPVVWILTGLSIIALTIILMKLWQFALMRPESSSHLDRVIDNWKQGESQQAIALLKHSRPVDELVLMSIKGLNSVNTELETLKEELDRVATLRLNQLRAYLRPLRLVRWYLAGIVNNSSWFGCSHPRRYGT